MEGFESFVGVDFWTCLFTLCNLIILFLVMRKFLFKPVKKMIEDRQKEIDGLYDDADKKNEEAERLQKEYREKLDMANAESEEILKKAQRKAQLREEEILRDAQEKAKITLKRAEEQVEMEKKRAVNDIKDEVSGMAVDIASAIIERDVSEDEHRELIDKFIGELGEK